MAGPSFPRPGQLAFRFAANIFLGSAIAWHALRLLDVSNPIWAIAALVAVSDPDPGVATRMFASRLVNVMVGAGVGLAFLLPGPAEWKLPVALSTTVLISSYAVRVQTMWRQAPITAALVIAAGLTHHSSSTGIEVALHKVAEVLFGCVVGLLVSWFMASIWPLPPSGQPTTDA